MANNQDNNDQQYQIERYLKGKMKQEEQQAFEKEMETDPSLKKAVEDAYVFLLAMENEEALTADLKDSWQKLQAIRTTSEVDWENTEDKKTFLSLFSPTMLKWAKWAALVVFAIGGAAYWGFFGNDQSLFETYYEKPPNTLVFKERGATSGEKPQQLRKIMEYYENAEYKRALPLTKKYLADHQNPDLAFYQGVMLIETNHPEKAIEVFGGLQKDKGKPEAKVLWYNALAYLANKQEQKAKKQLQLLLESSAPRYHEDAQNLLQKLNSPD